MQEEGAYRRLYEIQTETEKHGALMPRRSPVAP
jgi:hypothetical protein